MMSPLLPPSSYRPAPMSPLIGTGATWSTADLTSPSMTPVAIEGRKVPRYRLGSVNVYGDAGQGDEWWFGQSPAPQSLHSGDGEGNGRSRRRGSKHVWKTPDHFEQQMWSPSGAWPPQMPLPHAFNGDMMGQPGWQQPNQWNQACWMQQGPSQWLQNGGNRAQQQESRRSESRRSKAEQAAKDSGDGRNGRNG